MISYSSWNTVKSHANQYLITDVLKGELGFQGIVVSDYNGVDKLSQVAYDGIIPFKDSDLVDITDNVKAKVPQGQPGWQLQLRDGGWIGEKVLAEARTFNNQVMFTTFRPSQNATSSVPLSAMPELLAPDIRPSIDGGVRRWMIVVWAATSSPFAIPPTSAAG